MSRFHLDTKSMKVEDFYSDGEAMMEKLSEEWESKANALINRRWKALDE